MKSLKEIRFISRSTVREIAILVIGIMIAFSLDAWWDKVSVQSGLQEHAGLVLDELRTTEERLESAVTRHKLYAENARWLAQQLESAEPNSIVSVPDTTLASLMLQSTIDIGVSSVTSFLNSGGTSLIGNPADRTLIRSWPTTVEDIMDDQLYLRDTYTVPLASFVRSKYDLGHSEQNYIIYLSAITFKTPDLLNDLEFQSVELRSDVELKNLLNARYSIENITSVTLSNRLQTTRKLIRIMEGID